MTTVLNIAYAANDVYYDSNGGWQKVLASQGLVRGQYRWNIACKYADQLNETPYFQWLDRQSFDDLDLKYVLSDHKLSNKLGHLTAHLKGAKTNAEKIKRLKWFLACYATQDSVKNNIVRRGQQEAGMYAATYVSQSDQTKIIAFRGSEGAMLMPWEKDWFFNYHLFTTYKTQFESALKFAEAAIAANGWQREDVILCGHSLGGGLAKYVAFVWATCKGKPAKATFGFNAPQLCPGPLSFPISSAIAVAGTALGRGTLWGEAALPDINRPFTRDHLGLCVGINTLLDPVSKFGSAIAPQQDMRIDPSTDLPKTNCFWTTLLHRIPVVGSHSMVNVIKTLENSNKHIGNAKAMDYVRMKNR